jgi:hypothetical protein
MAALGYTALWIISVILGAIVGLFIGWVVWALGFELIGSAIALVGAGAGGIIAFLAFLSWGDRIAERRVGTKG